MQTYRGRRSSSSAARGEALGLRRQGVPRLPRRDLGLLGRPLPPRRGRGGARAGRQADPHLQPLSDRGRCGWPSGSATRASAAGRSSATPGPRRTSARSSWPASTPTAAASPSPRSSSWRAPSTAGRWARSRRPPGLATNESFAPLSAGLPGGPRDDAEALATAGRREHRGGHARADPGGDGGPPDPDEVIAAAREACDAAGALLVFDEIQTGMGQDRLALGLRAAAGAARRDDHGQGARRRAAGGRLRHHAAAAADVLERGDHGSTFAGGPLVAPPPWRPST